MQTPAKAQNSIPTTDNLIRRGCQIQNLTRYLCNQFPETVDHPFLHCSYSHAIWNYFLGGHNARWVQAGTLTRQLQAWKFRRGQNRGRKLWPLIIFVIVWTPWDERNRRVMAQKRPKSERETIT